MVWHFRLFGHRFSGGRSVMGLVAVLAVFAGLPDSGSGAVLAEEAVTASFDWRMPERFGMDGNGDGLIDTNPPAATVFPSSWPVLLDGCGSRGGSSPIVLYVWQIAGPGIDGARTEGRAECELWHAFPREGVYQVSLTVLTATGGAAVQSKAVAIDDWLVIAIGDSVSSGEGNPDLPGPVSPTGVAVWQHEPCHRSVWSGPAISALGLEASTRHTSVTFVHLACSGATIGEGLIGPYAGVSPDGRLLPPQVEQAAALFHEAGALGLPVRPIDALLVSVGANDMGFFRVALSCFLLESCQQHVIGRPEALEAWHIAQTGLATLPEGYARLDAALNAFLGPVLAPDRVFLAEYFDLSTDGSGNACTDILGGFSQDEVLWVRDVLLPSLNRVVREGAAAHGWNYVGGINSTFAGHGYCAQDHWITRLEESLILQGNFYGTLHPNGAGHLSYGSNLFASMASRLLAGQPALTLSQEVTREARAAHRRAVAATREAPAVAPPDGLLEAWRRSN